MIAILQGFVLLYILVLCNSYNCYKCSIINSNRYSNSNRYINSNRYSNSNSNRYNNIQIYAKKERPLDDLPLELCDESAEQVINEVRSELGTIFGYDPASQNVGITGKIELVEIDGPTIKVALNGRFWHATDTVMLRVKSFIQNRIPEVIDVILDMDQSSIIDDNRLGNNKLY
jgi:hypothetical protein